MKKTILFVSAAIVALTFAACGGQGGSNNENGEDTAAVAVVQDTTAQATEAVEAVEAVEEETTLNASLLGKYSNHNDPLIDLEVSDKYGTYGERKGYGYVSASNEYFETDFILVFTSITPDGNNIKVHYNKLEMSFEGGDPDDLGAEDAGEWVEQKVGEGDLTLIPAGAGKVKIDSKEGRIKNKVLSK